MSKLEKIKEILNEDKRLCERLCLPLKVYYSQELIEENIEWIGPVQLDNASGNGLMFHCQDDMAKGTKLSIRLYIEDDLTPIDFEGEIVWVKLEDGEDNQVALKSDRGYLYGVFLKEKDEKEYQRLVTYIADNIINQYLDDQGRIKEA